MGLLYTVYNEKEYAMGFKKTFSGTLLCGLMFSSQASAILITGGTFAGTDVGVIDTLLGTTTNLKSINSLCPNGSSEAAELCWATSLTSVAYTLAGKEAATAYTTNSAGVIAFQLNFGPGTYIVKNSTDWGLFTNLAEVNWGVIDTAALGGFNLSDTQLTISHVTEFDGGGGGITQVISEPASFLLFSTGLLGLGWVRRLRAAGKTAV